MPDALDVFAADLDAGGGPVAVDGLALGGSATYTRVLRDYLAVSSADADLAGGPAIPSGVVLDGAATQARQIDSTVSGGIVLDGSAAAALEPSPQGGIVLNGSALAVVTRAVSAIGGSGFPDGWLERMLSVPRVTRVTPTAAPTADDDDLAVLIALGLI